MTSTDLIAAEIAQHDAQCAWLAGFIDGEGSIGVSRRTDRRRHGQVGYRPAIQLANTNRSSLEWARAIMCVPTASIATLAPQTARHAAQYHMNVRNPRIVALTLARVLPFLTIKQQQARLVLEFCRSRLAVRGRGRYAKFTSREANIYQTLKTLNRRGPKDCL